MQGLREVEIESEQTPQKREGSVERLCPAPSCPTQAKGRPERATREIGTRLLIEGS